MQKILCRLGCTSLLSIVLAQNAPTAPTASSATPAPTRHQDLPDCVCKDIWVNGDGLCNSSNPVSDHGAISMRGCPSLEVIALCEHEPVASYCETTQALCKQQYGAEMEGQMWAYCNPETNVPELPQCTCKSRWENDECSSLFSVMKGCPTIEQLKQCNSSYTDDDQPWCETNERFCQQQEDGPGENMVGQSWAYCDSRTQETELPECECKSSWTTHLGDCPNGTAGQRLYRCPTVSQIRQCDPSYTNDDEQTWCRTTRARCREQTVMANGNEDMRNDSWAMCNPETNDAELPLCECQATWVHQEGKCEDAPLILEGCPDPKRLLLCDYVVEQSWCDTTFVACDEQNYESDDEGWSYCNPDTDMGEYGLCECEDTWLNIEERCEAPAGHALKMHGCPTLEALQRCDPDETTVWCETKDDWCKGQVNDQVGEGWYGCGGDSYDSTPSDSDVGQAIGLSVAVTLALCAIIVAVAVYFVRTYRYEIYSFYAGITPLPDSQHKLLTGTYGESSTS
mmetsp:Transcript_13781/g.35407  ORF Transcript_13781/g.35407 Transcript_13781/m.35407 type:complete len:511 (+) Transcript_13781:98-1630(+)